MLWASSLAGLALALGGALGYWWPRTSLRFTAAALGLAGGMMASVALIDLLPRSVGQVGPVLAFAWSVAGLVVISAVERVIPHHSCANGRGEDHRGCHYAVPTASALPTISMIMVAGVIAVHNLMEGATVSISYAAGGELGLGIAVAAGLHNLPIGMALAPSGQSRTARLAGLVILAVAGLATPLGTLAGSRLFPLADRSFPTASAFVGGTMLALALWELMPRALVAHRGWAVAAALGGALAMHFLGD